MIDCCDGKGAFTALSERGKEPCHSISVLNWVYLSSLMWLQKEKSAFVCTNVNKAVVKGVVKYHLQPACSVVDNPYCK